MRLSRPPFPLPYICLKMMNIAEIFFFKKALDRDLE